MLAKWSMPCLAAMIAVGTTTALQPSSFLSSDIVVIGGGASGAYAAVRLRDDYHKSTTLVEMQSGLVRTSSK